MAKEDIVLNEGNYPNAIKHVIVIMSGKGGVGKSTVCANLAVALSDSGLKVGVLDSDFHGPTIPKLLGIKDKTPKVSKDGVILPVEASPNIKVMSVAFLVEGDAPLIWRGPLKANLAKQFIESTYWGELDCLVVDLPPGTGDEPLNIAQMIPDADGAILVTTPQEVSMMSVRKAINFAKSVKMPIIGIIENMSGMVCPHCGKRIDVFEKGVVEESAKKMGVPYLGSVPIDPALARDADKGVPFVRWKESRESKNSFEKICASIKKSVEKCD